MRLRALTVRYSIIGRRGASNDWRHSRRSSAADCQCQWLSPSVSRDHNEAGSATLLSFPQWSISWSSAFWKKKLIIDYPINIRDITIFPSTIPRPWVFFSRKRNRPTTTGKGVEGEYMSYFAHDQLGELVPFSANWRHNFGAFFHELTVSSSHAFTFKTINPIIKRFSVCCCCCVGGDRW